MLMRLISKYSKEDRLKYISHLDMMRTFHRAIRRATLPVAFSQGFNPHPKLAFASALSVGLTSEGEYLDTVMESDIAPEEFSTKLNRVLPSGLRVIRSVNIDIKNPSLMSMIERASYSIFIPVAVKELAAQIDAFLDQPYVLVTGEKSNALKHINIRPMIHWVKPRLNDYSEQTVVVMLNSGSKSNLKPKLFADALFRFLKEDSSTMNYKIHRLDMYLFKNDKFVTPLDLVEG